MQVSDSISTLLSDLIGGPTSSKWSCWAFPESGRNLTLNFETHGTKNGAFLTSFSMHKLTTKWPLGPTMTPRVFQAWETKLPAIIWHEFGQFGHWLLWTCRRAVTKNNMFNHLFERLDSKIREHFRRSNSVRTVKENWLPKSRHFDLLMTYPARRNVRSG